MNDLHETDNAAVIHLSFVDERRLEVFGEAVIDAAHIEVDEVYQLGDRLFFVDDIWATYLDEKGRDIGIDDAPEGALFVAFVTLVLVETEWRYAQLEGVTPEPEQQAELEPCGACGGELYELGVMGRSRHLRCRACGLDSTVRASCEGSSR